jgi:FKBP-type peptidyl-prolyl cis-trans isomerase FkpA
MNRFLKVFTLIAAIGLVSSCKDDEDNNIAPPRPFAEQYAAEKVAIEDFIDKNYISVDADMNVTFGAKNSTNPVSIKDQTTYPLLSKLVTRDNVEYKVYYIVLNPGVGKAPTRADNILAAYRGTLLNGTQFDYLPFPQTISSLSGAIQGWQEIIPLFKEGVFDASPSPNPASFTNYGAGVMILPSALAYYNNALASAPAYSTMVFSFKLYRVEDADSDNDGLINRNELGDKTDVADYDTDNDGVPNYLDTDDDNDGILTRQEISIAGIVRPFNDIPLCNNGEKVHLDPDCK